MKQLLLSLGVICLLTISCVTANNVNSVNFEISNGNEGKIYLTKQNSEYKNESHTANDIIIEGSASEDILFGKIKILGNKYKHFTWSGNIITTNSTYHIEISSIVSDDQLDGFRYFGDINFKLPNDHRINHFDINRTTNIQKLPYTLIVYSKNDKSKLVTMTKNPYIFHAFGFLKQVFFSYDLISYSKQDFSILDENNNTIGELIEDNYSVEQTLSPNELEDTRFLIGCIAALKSMIKELYMVIL